jgi:hypothetical protein
MLVMEPSLSHHIELDGKSIEISLTEQARNALSARTRPLNVEMELYFSCLIRKKVRFHDSYNHQQGVSVNDRLYIHFRPVMTQACGKDYEGAEPPLTDFPISNQRAYIPHWLKIDFHNGQWLGEFGYRSKHR